MSLIRMILFSNEVSCGSAPYSHTSRGMSLANTVIRINDLLSSCPFFFISLLFLLFLCTNLWFHFIDSNECVMSHTNLGMPLANDVMRINQIIKCTYKCTRMCTHTRTHIHTHTHIHTDTHTLTRTHTHTHTHTHIQLVCDKRTWHVCRHAHMLHVCVVGNAACMCGVMCGAKQSLLTPLCMYDACMMHSCVICMCGGKCRTYVWRDVWRDAITFDTTIHVWRIRRWYDIQSSQSCVCVTQTHLTCQYTCINAAGKCGGKCRIHVWRDVWRDATTSDTTVHVWRVRMWYDIHRLQS